MFVAFFNENAHGRDRDNYTTCHITESGALVAESKEELLDDMFTREEYHRKSQKKDSDYYSSVSWLGMHEIDVKNTFYQDWEFNINWDYDGNTSESELSAMITNSEKGKKAAADKEKERKRQERKRKEDKKILEQKRIVKKAEGDKLKELQDREDYDRLKLKFEGEGS